jgi:hypothetical protein
MPEQTIDQLRSSFRGELIQTTDASYGLGVLAREELGAVLRIRAPDESSVRLEKT